MKSLQLTAVILLLMYTDVQGRAENVSCEFDYRFERCLIRFVRNSQQPISVVIFDNDLIRSVEELRITGGNLERIPDLSDAARKFTGMKRVVLRNVGLKIVNGENFAAFESLPSLYIEKHEISYLDADSFKELRDIQVLSLIENSLEILPVSIFNNNKKLVVIDISDNKLKEIHGDTFRGLEHLSQLIMSFNQFETLPVNLFRDNKELTLLNLAENRLEEIHGDTFEELSKLNDVRLFSNQLETLPSTIFRNNKELVYIYLSYNKLKAIDRDTFKGLNQLQTLTLHNNQIEVLPRGLFDDNSQLSFLDLKNNKLIKIEADLRSLHVLQSLKLARNVCINENCYYPHCSSYSLNILINDIEQSCSN